MSLPPISFYLPQSYFPQNLPVNEKENWQGFGLGIYAWTLQTYLHLKGNNFPCQLVSQLPSEGIVLFHRNALRVHKKHLKPDSRRLLVCIKAEERSYPYAQIHIVQNPQEANTQKNKYYLPHWPQPGLIPRRENRGDRFENIAYFGHIINLAPELQDSAWERELASLGLRWLPVINSNAWNNYNKVDNRWNDYSEIDAIVAVRSFGKSNLYKNKPATKLFNAWLAGVPALLGAESAYQTEGEQGINYLEVNSPQELIAGLKQLKTNPALWQTLVKKGVERSQYFSPEKITQKWIQFLTEIATPIYYKWCATPSYFKSVILEKNKFEYRIERTKSKLRSLYE